jgi:replicative DNA helicase
MAANIDRCFISLLISSGDVKVFVEARSIVKFEMVREPDRSVYKFCSEYFDKYRKVPIFSLIEENFHADFKEVCDAELSYYIEELRNREAYNQVSVKLNELYPLMEKGRGLEALEKLDLSVKEIYKGISAPEDIRSLFSYGPEVMEMYEKAKKGIIGISSPWPTLTALTMGWQPEDLAIFIARSGVGKTWALILMAKHAWEVDKKKVLFISPEIANARVLFRMLSNQLKVDYEAMRKGRLGEMMEAKMRKFIDDLIANDDGRFKIVGRDFGSDMRAVEKAAIIVEPDIIFVDGVYLLNRGKSSVEKHERIANVFACQIYFSLVYNSIPNENVKIASV